MSARNTYRRSMSGWYRKNPVYVWYMLRELTAVFLAGYAALLLFGLAALVRGPAAWEAFLAFLASPLSVGLHAIMLVAALYNAWTWFRVSPKAIPPVYIGRERIPDRVVIGAQAAAFVVVTVCLVLLVRAA
jgi:fumarate reductase subunit C